MPAGAGKLLGNLPGTYVLGRGRERWSGICRMSECGTLALAIAPEGVLKWHYPKERFRDHVPKAKGGFLRLKWWVERLLGPPSCCVPQIHNCRKPSAIFPWVRECPSTESLHTRSGRHIQVTQTFSLRWVLGCHEHLDEPRIWEEPEFLKTL